MKTYIYHIVALIKMHICRICSLVEFYWRRI